MNRFFASFLATNFLFVCACFAPAAFNIQLNPTGLTPAVRSEIDWAVDQLERRITGYQPGISIPQVTINASLSNLSGNIIGQGGFTTTTNQGGYRLATSGFVRFDTDTIDQLLDLGLVRFVAFHEIAHALGFGTLWTNNPGVVSGNQYIGKNAVRAFQNDWNHPGGVIPTSIPLETSGDQGTRLRHWDEPDAVINGQLTFGTAFTGITLKSDPPLVPARDLTYEIMTGGLNYIQYDPIISNMTIQSFADIGYTVVPEPNSIAIGVCGFTLLAIWRQRRLATRRRPA